MTKGSDNYFNEVTEEMILEKFRVEDLQTYLSHRNKSSDGGFGALAYRLVLFFLSANIFSYI